MQHLPETSKPTILQSQPFHRKDYFYVKIFEFFYISSFSAKCWQNSASIDIQ